MAVEKTVVLKDAPSEKSRTITLILCLLGFIGIAGIHHIYVGKTFMGVVYFFTLGLFFIGTILSTLSILLGNFQDHKWRTVSEW